MGANLTDANIDSAYLDNANFKNAIMPNGKIHLVVPVIEAQESKQEKETEQIILLAQSNTHIGFQVIGKDYRYNNLFHFLFRKSFIWFIFDVFHQDS